MSNPSEVPGYVPPAGWRILRDDEPVGPDAAFSHTLDGGEGPVGAGSLRELNVTMDGRSHRQLRRVYMPNGGYILTPFTPTDVEREILPEELPQPGPHMIIVDDPLQPPTDTGLLQPAPCATFSPEHVGPMVHFDTVEEMVHAFSEGDAKLDQMASDVLDPVEPQRVSGYTDATHYYWEPKAGDVWPKRLEYRPRGSLEPWQRDNCTKAGKEVQPDEAEQAERWDIRLPLKDYPGSHPLGTVRPAVAAPADDLPTRTPLTPTDRLFPEAEALLPGDVLMAGGKVASSACPPYHLIPKAALEMLANQCGLGVKRKGKKAWNALSDNQDVLTDREFVLERISHGINHAMKMRDRILRNDFSDMETENDAAAVMWCGMFLCSAADAMMKQKAGE